MKKIIVYISSLVFLASSCTENFLDVNPMTSVLDNNFYKTVADAEMALIRDL
jgi:hypothetical protein